MDNYRITALKEYCLTKVLQPVSEDITSVNVNFLSNNIDDFSLVRIPVEPVLEKWVTGETLNQEVYNLISRKSYSPETSSNLENLGFFESVEAKVRENDNNKILPEIEGIEKISCLNCGTAIDRDTNTNVFSIQLQIIYRG